jgi:predicted KAP-like P-loop ATPase
MDANGDGFDFLTDSLPEDTTQDVLNRKKFVETLAARILKFKDSNCLIIGIHGPWGSGKSTFLKFLELEIGNEYEDAVIVHFNPWNYSSIDQLVILFFKELRSSIKKGKNLRQLSLEIGEKLELLGKVLSPLEVLHSFVGVPTGVEKIPSALEKTGSGIKQLLEQDPLAIKKELNDLLKKYNKKIIVFIDDIDRLDKESMRLLFRLIRLNADFINTIYILSFDRKVVEGALEGEQGASGRDYLKKFVQVPFDLPLPDHKIISDILSEKIGDIFPASSKNDFESYRGNNLCNKFYEFFRTLRDVKRYTNSLLLTSPSIADEINYLDFAAIEAIRVFYPDVYNEIANNKDLLLGNKPFFTLELNKTEIELRKNKINDIIKLVGSHKDQEIVKNILSDLFPHAGEAGYDGNSRSYRIGKRICSQDRFDKYFLLDVPKGEISQAQIDAALKIINDKDTFICLLKEYKDHNILMQFLERMKDYIADLSLENKKNIINILLDIGDELSKMSNGRMNRTTEAQMGFMIIDLLEKVDLSLHAGILRDCICEGRGFHLLLYVMFHINKDMDTKRLLSNQEFETIKKLTVSRIQREASKKNFINMPHLRGTLLIWKEFADINEPKKAVSRLIVEDHGVIRLLAEFLTEYTIDYNEARYAMRDDDLTQLSEFADLSAIYTRVKGIENGKSDLISDELSKIAVQDFIKLYEQRNIRIENI